MAGKFADLRAKMSPEARARSAAKAQALLGGGSFSRSGEGGAGRDG